MGIKYTSFGVKYQNILLSMKIRNYKEMMVETPICIRYAVLTIVIFTSMLAIGSPPTPDGNEIHHDVSELVVVVVVVVGVEVWCGVVVCLFCT